jgi:hypothetical protein
MLSYAAVIFIFTFPVITYYQAGFIPSSTSFSISIIGYWHYLNYLQSGRQKGLNTAVLFFAAASLCRTPFNIVLFAVLFQEIIRSIRAKQFKIKRYIPFIAAYTCIAGYNIYKGYLNSRYGSQFLTSFYPAADIPELISLTKEVIGRWKWQVFTLFHYLVLTVPAIIFLWQLRGKFRFSSISSQVMLQAALLMAGFIIYYLLMSRQFFAHEYYFIDSFYLIPVLIIILLSRWLAQRNFLKPRSASPVIVLLLLCCVYGSYQVHRSKYSFQLWDTAEITRRNFTGADALLDSLQIPRKARMLVLYAASTNGPLIQMGRNGFTVINTDYNNIDSAMRLNYDYIAAQDIFVPSEIINNYPPFLSQISRVGGNGRISIFKRSDSINQPPLTLAGALGLQPAGISSFLNFDSLPPPGWDNCNVLTNSAYQSAPKAFVLQAGAEFGPTYETAHNRQYRKLLFEGSVRPALDGRDLKIVCTSSINGKQVYYWEFSAGNLPQGKWSRFACLFHLPEMTDVNQKIRCFVWNPGLAEYCIDNIRLSFFNQQQTPE